MNLLKQKEEEAQLKVEDLQGKVKTLEHENLAKEQEITSLSHKNQLLEAEVEKLDEGLKIAKRELDEGRDSGTHNEGLQRRLQLLEEEAEEADKNIRETNEKYVHVTPHNGIFTPFSFWEHTSSTKLMDLFIQASTNGCQSGALRTQSTGSGKLS